MTQDKQVIFCWIPSHSSIDGNELADKTAKEATLLINIDNNIPILHQDFLKKVKKYYYTKDDENWCSNPNNKLKTIRNSLFDQNPAINFSRKEQSVLTRIRIGHTNLSHIHLINKDEPNKCIKCQAVFTTDHLFQCPALQNIRISLNLTDNKNVILNNEEKCKIFIKYLKKIQIYNCI